MVTGDLHMADLNTLLGDDQPVMISERDQIMQMICLHVRWMPSDYGLSGDLEGVNDAADAIMAATAQPIEWGAVAEEALGVMKVAADVAAKKAADEIYARILDSAQDYLTDNLRFNIASTLATAERERKAAQDRVGGLLAIIGEQHAALQLARAICRDAFKDIAMEWDKESMATIDAAIARADARQ